MYISKTCFSSLVLLLITLNIKIQLSMLVLYKADLIIISLKINLFLPWLSWKIAELAFNNNHSLTHPSYILSHILWQREVITLINSHLGDEKKLTNNKIHEYVKRWNLIKGEIIDMVLENLPWTYTIMDRIKWRKYFEGNKSFL